jgi:hypothetical protein
MRGPASLCGVDIAASGCFFVSATAMAMGLGSGGGMGWLVTLVQSHFRGGVHVGADGLRGKIMASQTCA